MHIARRTLSLILISIPCAAQAQAVQRSTSATIEVVGGPHAGKHTASLDVGCRISERSKRGKSFSGNVGVPPTDPRSKDPKALTSVMVNIGNTSAKGPPSQADFEASITFGPLMDTRLGTFYMSGSNTTTGRTGGSGTLILKDGGKDDAQVTFDLQPQPGVAVKGIITCKNLIRY